MNLLNFFRRKRVIKIKLTRFDKRHYVVQSANGELPMIDYINSIAVKLNRLFPEKTVREYYQPIYRAHMRNGPAEAKQVANKLLLHAKLNTISTWYGKCWGYIKMRWKMAFA